MSFFLSPSGWIIQPLFSTELPHWAMFILLLLISLMNISINRSPTPSLLRIPWISRGWTPAGGAWDRLFEGKLPKAIRVISPISTPPPFLEQSGSSALLFTLRTVWVISPTAPPSEQSGSSALLFFQYLGRLGPHSGCRGPPCRIDRARGVGNIESVKALDLERENGFWS